MGLAVGGLVYLRIPRRVTFSSGRGGRVSEEDWGIASASWERGRTMDDWSVNRAATTGRRDTQRENEFVDNPNPALIPGTSREQNVQSMRAHDELLYNSLFWNQGITDRKVSSDPQMYRARALVNEACGPGAMLLYSRNTFRAELGLLEVGELHALIRQQKSKIQAMNRGALVGIRFTTCGLL